MRSFGDDTDLDHAQRSALEALGWSAPDGIDRPAWSCDGPLAEVEALVAMAIGTLRHVFDVVDPGFLEVKPCSPPSRDPRERRRPGHAPGRSRGRRRRRLRRPDRRRSGPGFPTTTEEMAALLVRVMRSTYGDDIARDQDGDFPVWTGTVPVWITPLGEHRPCGSSATS